MGQAELNLRARISASTCRSWVAVANTYPLAGGGPAILDRSETPEIRKVAFTAPFHWLGAGWKDLWAAPLLSLAYGAVFAAFAYVAAIQLTRFDALPLLLPLAFGFLSSFVADIIA